MNMDDMEKIQNNLKYLKGNVKPLTAKTTKKFDEVVSFYEKGDKLEKVKEYLHDLLGKNYDVYLRILDPRVNHFDCYGELLAADCKKIMEIYPQAKLSVSQENTIDNISVSGKVGFTIYNVIGEEKEKLIKVHDDEYNKLKDESKRVVY